MDSDSRRRSQQAESLDIDQPPQARAARRARLSPSLRRSLVYGYPWIGFPLSALINLVEPTSKAKYIQFVTLLAPDQMPGQRSGALDWPYVEGLRMDEAMHPLAILATGLYGQVLPNQNGAPIRLVVPWKYGFKSIKSIVKLRFVEAQPATSWNLARAGRIRLLFQRQSERESSALEAKPANAGSGVRQRATLMFNGYADQVRSYIAAWICGKTFESARPCHCLLPLALILVVILARFHSLLRPVCKLKARGDAVFFRLTPLLLRLASGRTTRSPGAQSACSLMLFVGSDIVADRHARSIRTFGR